MARRRRRSSQSITHPITFPDAVPQTPLADRLLRNTSVVPSPLREVEDRRTYHPLDFFRPARLVSGVSSPPHKVSKSTGNKYSRLPFGLQFAVPDKTVVCVRRKQRKEVLHAKRKTGRGVGRRKSPTRNYYSGVQCR